MRSETRGVSSRQGLDHWRGGWGDSGVHLYPKSNKIIGVVYLGVGGVRKTHPDLSFKKTLLCLKMVWRGNHSPPASPVRPPSPHPSRARMLPPALGKLVPGTAPHPGLPCPALPPVLLAGPLHGCKNVPFSTAFHGPPSAAPTTASQVQGTILAQVSSSSTRDDSRIRPKSGTIATASWNGYHSCCLAAVTEVCCVCFIIHPAFSSSNTPSLCHPSQSIQLGLSRPPPTRVR